ncbi:hypothetical protein [Candidiatus Paracoxiella cheracis]|uniref:hypothetical protein n=1 Tax=Candidiatus Paracoxiella cheracis TaxID=3405120 RepID=UPI003BF60BA4
MDYSKSVYLSSLAYAVVTALSIALIHIFTQGSVPLLLLSASALLAIIWFNGINYRRLAALYTPSLRQLKFIIVVNIIIAIQWTATFYGAKFSVPFNFLLVAFTMPLIISNIVLIRRGKSHILSLCFNLTLCGLVIYTMKNPIGVYCALAVGVLAYIYRKYTYIVMKKENYTRLDILCLRNYGLLAVSLGAYFIYHSQITMVWPSPYALIVIPLISFIIPIYLNQAGIKNAGAERHSAIASLTPMLAIGISLLLGVKDLTTSSLIIGAIAALALIIQNLYWKE